MHETQTQGPSPEELIVQDLTIDADRALEQYGQPLGEDMLPEGFEGTVDRATSSDGGFVLTRITGQDGSASYELSAVWSDQYGSGGVNRRWQRGGNVINANNSSDDGTATEEREVEGEQMTNVGDKLNEVFPDSSGTGGTEPQAPRRFRGGRPRQGRHRADTPVVATDPEQEDAAADTAAQVDEGELAAVGDVAESSLEDEQAERAAEYERRLNGAETQIDAWAEDPTIKWKPNNRKENPEGNRYIEYPVPSDDGRSWLTSRVSVVDEPGKERWYIMHVTHGESTLVIYWQKGGELVRARRADRKEPHEANLGEMGLVQKVTDSDQARIKHRKPQATAEEVQDGSWVAHRIGRLLGSRTVTRWK